MTAKKRYDITREMMVADIAAGLKHKEMAAKYGCSIENVSYHRGKFNLRTGRRPRRKKTLSELPRETFSLSPVEPMVPILEMDMLAFCRLARMARTKELIEKMGGCAS